MTILEKTYNPQTIEKNWYQKWETEGSFKPQGDGTPYCIMLPPPNVTGTLHMGHGFGFTLMDVLIRYHRMKGDKTLWQAGTDHAGIATQMVVERRLNQEGKTRHDLGREAFIETVWEWKRASEGTIKSQLRRLGASLDWSRERFTLDEELSYAVRDVFIRLFNEGLIYRGERLVNWDPELLTAVSDLEVINEETEGNLWHIAYPLQEGGQGELIVATTRPETLLGDVAVAVHPDDERYKTLIGKLLQLPLTDRLIPIIADEYVDPTFGSGAVKITPAHDFNDFEVGNRHHFKPINIFTATAHLNENVPKKYQGLERFKARKIVLEDLKSQGLIKKTDKHLLKIPRGEKTNAVIEPYLTKQWFMNMKPLAEAASLAVADEKIRFIPENWTKTYFQWMENIEDWCISRQLWWGHRIPVWYDDQGNPYAGHDESDVRKRYELSDAIKLTQDNDVLDTWFSSALWPFSTLGWPQETEELKTFFPTNVLVTGFDIIFFWVARMIMMSLKLTGQVPFKEVYLTGLIRDADGQKMSKSKGNIIDPIDLIDGIELEKLVRKRTFGLMQPKMAEKIEKHTRSEFPNGIQSYGTDALRFTFCAVASYTREIRFDTNRLGGYRNFCNKLWNAARYVLMNTSTVDPNDLVEEKILTTSDLWILSQLQQTISQAENALKEYRFDHYAQTLYDFTWNEFCDWYLELSKPVLTSPHSTHKLLRGTRFTLIYVLESLLRLLHPIIPYITEEIWQHVAKIAGKEGDTISLQPYPHSDANWINEESETEINWVKNVVVAIRTIRSEMNISPAKKLNALFKNGDEKDKVYCENNMQLILSLAKLDSITWVKDERKISNAASHFINRLEIYIPLADFIDKDEEKARLEKEKVKIEKESLHIENKLNDSNFVEKAPKEVVEKEKIRLQSLQDKHTKLKAQLLELSKW